MSAQPPSTTVPENIILVGFMGSGKSSIGRIISRRLGFQFLDTDQMVIDRAGKAISDIFAEDGEEAFRNLESAALSSLAHLRRCVVATGGGAVLREGNRRLMHEIGFTVCLTASPSVTFDRVSRNNKRPLLQTENPRETMENLLEARRDFYVQAAQCTIDTSNLSQPEVAEFIIREARRAFLWDRGA